ncbi:MAG: hypothetical protein ACQETP_04845, partial [Bacteroidota bacterium]
MAYQACKHTPTSTKKLESLCSSNSKSHARRAQTAFGAALSCVGNIGPGWGTVGPTENYAHLPALSKWILSFL